MLVVYHFLNLVYAHMDHTQSIDRRLRNWLSLLHSIDYLFFHEISQTFISYTNNLFIKLLL